MSDKPDSLDALANVRKRCPRCGHENHPLAKVCVNCGYEFPLTIPTEDGPSMICPKCGHANRPGAKICSQCGTALPTEAVPPPAPTPSVGVKVKRAKKCPECGTVNKLDAKVCPNCGHRFQTDFSQAAQPVPPPPVIAEPPVVQMPSTGITLPPQFDELSHQPDLPPAPAPPPAPVPVVPSVPVPAPPANAAPDASANLDDTSGEPAPDLTEQDIEALRRRSPDHSDFSGRVSISFRKDRS